MNLKDKILWVCFYLLNTVLPIFLALTFSVGIFFNLWKVQELSFGLSLIISIVVGGGITFGFGKLIKLW
jgi:hypothetical protein